MMDVEKQKLNPNEVDLFADGFGAYCSKSVNALLFQNWFNALLLATIPAMMGVQLGWNDGVIFLFSLVAIAPFAERLSFVTEQLALHTSETLGGLLNATFGNVTELIVSLFALRMGMLRIVQVSLLGSVLSNLLLVLGCAFFAGGVRCRLQKFNKTAGTVSTGLLLLSTTAVVYPTFLGAVETAAKALVVSRCISVLMLLTYGGYVYFQLVTHTFLFDEEPAGGDEDDDDDEEEEPVLGVWGAIFWLAVITVFISILSEYMVDALEGAAENWGVPDLFLGTIIIPIVGNAAEHAAAIIFAVKNKMELALGIAVGSAIQISLFCVPALILTGWAFDANLSLDFKPFEAAAMLLTIMIVGGTISAGESTWLQGLMLVVAYCIVSAAYFVHEDVA